MLALLLALFAGYQTYCLLLNRAYRGAAPMIDDYLRRLAP